MRSRSAAGDLPEPSHIVVALGSGGTAAGLAAGLRIAGLRSRVVGVVVNDRTPVDARTVARLATRTLDLLRGRGADVPLRSILPGDLDSERAWLGAGYGHRTPAAEHARDLARRREGLELDPVYTAKAVAAPDGAAGARELSAAGRCSTGTRTARPGS